MRACTYAYTLLAPPFLPPLPRSHSLLPFSCFRSLYLTVGTFRSILDDPRYTRLALSQRTHGYRIFLAIFLPPLPSVSLSLSISTICMLFFVLSLIGQSSSSLFLFPFLSLSSSLFASLFASLSPAHVLSLPFFLSPSISFQPARSCSSSSRIISYFLFSLTYLLTSTPLARYHPHPFLHARMLSDVSLWETVVVLI